MQIAHVGLVVLFGGILGYVVLLSLPDIGRGSMAMLPQARRAQVAGFFTEVGRVMAGYVRARLIVSAAVLVPTTMLAASIRLPGSTLPRG